MPARRPRVVSCRHEFVTLPLLDALTLRGWEVRSDVVGAVSESVAADVDDGITIRIGTPLEYALAADVVESAILPGVAITTRGMAGLIRLVFNPGRELVDRVAMRRSRSYEHAVARIVLAEKHDLQPEFITVDDDADIQAMLDCADGALVAGDEALFGIGERRSVLDISDEWEDAFDASLPYLIAWGRVGVVDMEMIADISAARDEAVLALADYTSRSTNRHEAGRFYEACLRGDVSFNLGDDEIEGLETLFRYAFYHGTIHDVPAVKFLPAVDAG